MVQTASQLRWCTKPHCTTCGNREARARLKAIAFDAGFALANQLSELTPSEIVKLPNWDDCIRLAFFEIPLPGPQEKVLTSWLHNLHNDVQFADVVLFYIIRSLPFRESIGKDWIEKCVSLAIDTKNESLIESVLWTLGAKAKNYPAFLELAGQLTLSPTVVKALAACETGTV